MGLRILIVDDLEPILRSLRWILEQDGHVITTARSCAEARALTGPFDAGVFDLNLANGLGLDAAEEMLADGRVGSVVFHSATEDQALLARAGKVGPVVQKGDIDGLYAALAKLD